MDRAERAVVLVSGTSRGLGRYLAEHFVESGVFVVGCSRGECSMQHELYRHVPVDIADEQSVRELYMVVRREYGRLDVLVNSAAVNPSISLFMAVPTGALAAAFHTNVLGTMMMSRGAIALMMQGRFGRIVNIGSMAVRLEVPGESVYTSTKAALASYTRVLAKEVYPLGITCNMVAPAALPTTLSAQVRPAALEDVLRRNAIPTIGEFRDVSNLIDFLITPESHAVTGQVVYLGGA